MKSTIKVDYKSRYGDGDFGDKEPLITVNIIESDDPRDTLINEIFRDEGFAKIAVIERGPSSKNPEKQYVIFRRSDRERWINEFINPMYQALANYTGIEAIFVTGHDNMWFELSKESNVKSNGISQREVDNIRYEFNESHKRDVAIIDRVVAEWKQFEEAIKESLIVEKTNE